MSMHDYPHLRLVRPDDVVDVAPAPARPLARRWACECGKGSLAAHGPFTCDEVLRIRARVAHGRLPFLRRLSTAAPAGWFGGAL